MDAVTPPVPGQHNHAAETDVDGLVKTVAAGLNKGGCEGHDFQGVDIDAYHVPEQCRVCCGLEALVELEHRALRADEAAAALSSLQARHADAERAWESVANAIENGESHEILSPSSPLADCQRDALLADIEWWATANERLKGELAAAEARLADAERENKALRGELAANGYSGKDIERSVRLRGEGGSVIDRPRLAAIEIRARELAGAIHARGAIPARCWLTAIGEVLAAAEARLAETATRLASSEAMRRAMGDTIRLADEANEDLAERLAETERKLVEQYDLSGAEVVKRAVAEASAARAEEALRQACTNLATIRPDLTRDDTTIGFQAQLWYDALMAGWGGIEGFDHDRSTLSAGAEGTAG